MRESLSRFCSLQESLTPLEQRKYRRVHGLQLPLHPQQLAGWLLTLGIACGTCACLLPPVDTTHRSLVIGVLASLLLLNVISQLTVLLLDPADSQVRLKPSKTVVPEFDRTRHSHVIESGRCHLCNITIRSKRTKHCSICNKCVERFDHHCKWLNNCIGGRNYPAFIVYLLSTIGASLTVVAISSAELIVAMDSNNNNNNTTSSHLLDPMPGTTSLVVISIVGVLSAIVAILVIHLCFFHGYIACLGLTTYEYIRKKREQDNSRSKPPDDDDEAKQSSRYHLCHKSVTREAARAGDVYFCSSHEEQLAEITTNARDIVSDNRREKRNFRLYFTYEEEASIQVSSSTSSSQQQQTFEEMVNGMQHKQVAAQSPLTPSPVSCCFSITATMRTKRGGEKQETTRSCSTVRRIQSYFRARIRRGSSSRQGNNDVRRRNKVTPQEANVGNLEASIKDEDDEVVMPRTTVVKLPPLNFEQIAAAAAATSPASPGLAAIAGAMNKRNQQARTAARRLSMQKRPRFKIGAHLLQQTAQLSPIPESELSKPGSPRSPPKQLTTAKFAFPPVKITGANNNDRVL